MDRPPRRPFDKETIVPVLGIVAGSLLALNFLVFLSHQARSAEIHCGAYSHVSQRPSPPASWEYRVQTLDERRLQQDARWAEREARRMEREVRRMEREARRMEQRARQMEFHRRDVRARRGAPRRHEVIIAR